MAEYETMWGEITRRTDEREHYSDRWDRAVARRLELDVFVPSTIGALFTVDPGSGIVGSHGPALGQVTIDYEGNRFNSVNMRSWAERVYHAAGRHVSVYPTIARSFVAVGQLHKVGTFYCVDDTILVDDRDALRAWIAEDDESLFTATGRVLTEAAINRLSREAEKGYDPSSFKARPPRTV